MFDESSNDYETSFVRQFLNKTIYNTAFNFLEKEIMNEVEVNNFEFSNKYVGNNTLDKVWLLSYKDVFNTYFSLDSKRKKFSTDYAKCQGLAVDSSSGYSRWWLRSPNTNKPNSILFLDSFGDYGWECVYCTHNG